MRSFNTVIRKLFHRVTKYYYIIDLIQKLYFEVELLFVISWKGFHRFGMGGNIGGMETSWMLKFSYYSIQQTIPVSQFFSIWLYLQEQKQHLIYQWYSNITTNWFRFDSHERQIKTDCLDIGNIYSVSIYIIYL